MAINNGIRSEANSFPNKKNYKNYNLSKYPNNLDTRENINMRGFVNIGETKGVPDYVMAEYMNAALDAIMSIQKALGTTPMVYHGVTSDEVHDIIENFTIANRLTRIEDGLFDKRYGGDNWSPNPTNKRNAPVLNNHKHDGKNGHPSKIELTEDVSGLMPYKNIDLRHDSGLTGANISLSPTNPRQINLVISDLLSKPQGGTVTGDVNFTGVVKTRTSMDATASDMQGLSQLVSIVSDNEATSGQSISSSNTTSQVSLFTILEREKEHLLYGKYVLGVRLKKGKATENHTNLLEFSLGRKQMFVLDTDISNQYKTVHFVFEHNNITKENPIILYKLATSTEEEVFVDSYYITPIHPATLDI